MNILIEIKNVYGKEVIYPKCEKSTLIAKMLGQKTLTRSNLQYLKEIGFTFKTYNEEFKL